MGVAMPYRQRSSPFLEARAEILGPVDRVQNRDPAIMARRARFPRFLAYEGQPRQARGQKIADQRFQMDIGSGNRAVVRFPGDVVTHVLDPRHLGQDQITHIGKKGGYAGHGAFVGYWEASRAITSGFSRQSSP